MSKLTTYIVISSTHPDLPRAPPGNLNHGPTGLLPCDDLQDAEGEQTVSPINHWMEEPL